MQGFAAEAASYFESTLQFQPGFEPAAERLKAVRCISLLKHIQVYTMYMYTVCTLVQYTIYMYIVHVHVSFIILTISQKCIHEFSRLGIQVSCTFYFSFMINFCYSRLPGCRCTCLYIHVSR